MGRRPADFIRQVTATKLLHPDGTTTVEKRPAVWTLAHRGYSGSGRLDVWVYPSRAIALRVGAELALACGLEESDPEAVRLYQECGSVRGKLRRGPLRCRGCDTPGAR